ncbi:myb-related transcription factor, partner of profilin-like [Ambystoma mexicanum]|uniref:myb-related transcription factor, partner of profilin-like n=1 Tax=Ambystoma mexicanum TaxID=8296 RepID=UPI0037E8F4AA
MSKATRKTTPRLCKKRFSDDERNMLADTLAAHAEEIKLQNLKREVQQSKKEIWEEVARKASAVGTTPRTVKDCKKRWDDLRLRVQNILASNRREAMATGGGPHSPAKLSRWEETCSTFIQMESIEGFGEMETGAATSGDGGIDGEDVSEGPTTRASTSRPKTTATDKSTSGAASQPKPTPRASGQTMAAHEGPTSTPDTVDTELATPVEGEAVAPLSNIDTAVEEFVDQDGLTHVPCPHSQSPASTPKPHTQPSPTCSSADPLLHDSDLSSLPEDSTANEGPVAAPSTTAAPTTNLEARLARVEARQDSMLDLLRQ